MKGLISCQSRVLTASPDMLLGPWSGSEAPSWSSRWAVVALVGSAGLATVRGFASAAVGWTVPVFLTYSNWFILCFFPELFWHFDSCHAQHASFLSANPWLWWLESFIILWLIVEIQTLSNQNPRKAPSKGSAWLFDLAAPQITYLVPVWFLTSCEIWNKSMKYSLQYLENGKAW